MTIGRMIGDDHRPKVVGAFLGHVIAHGRHLGPFLIHHTMGIFEHLGVEPTAHRFGESSAQLVEVFQCRRFVVRVSVGLIEPLPSRDDHECEDDSIERTQCSKGHTCDFLVFLQASHGHQSSYNVKTEDTTATKYHGDENELRRYTPVFQKLHRLNPYSLGECSDKVDDPYASIGIMVASWRRFAMATVVRRGSYFRLGQRAHKSF